MIRKTLALASVLATLSTAAFAADLTQRPPDYESLPGVPNWNGFYVVGTVGAEKGKLAHRHEADSTFGGAGGTYDNDGQSAVYGVGAGYTRNLNGIVVGGEVGVRTGFSADDGGAYQQYNNTTRSEVDYLATARGRVGVDLGNFQPYVHAGYAGGRVTSFQDYSPPAGTGSTWKESSWKNGWTAGVGLDVQMTERVFVGAEYSYTDLGRTTHSGVASDGSPTTISSDLKSHTILGRLGFKF